MPIAIVLRTSGHTNFFRDAMIRALDSGEAGEALLCSGFFQENFHNSAYRASTEQMMADVCARNRVKLTTVGIHNHTWKHSYRNFRESLVAAGVDLSCLYKAGMRWHAKVFIASLPGGAPHFGIVGSSNITRNAFSTGANYNNECDVFMWTRASPVSALVESLTEAADDRIIIRAPFLRSYNQGKTLPELLANIKAQVLAQDLKDLE